MVVFNDPSMGVHKFVSDGIDFCDMQMHYKVPLELALHHLNVLSELFVQYLYIVEYSW